MVNKKGMFQKNKTLFLGVAALLMLAMVLWVLADSFDTPSANDLNLTGTVVLNCTFDSMANITNVSFYYNITLIGTDYNETEGDTKFNISWDTAARADGMYYLTCNATNISEGTASLTRTDIRLDNIAPLVTIPFPISGWYNSDFIINATVTDGSGTGARTVQYNSSGAGTLVTMSNDYGNFWNATFDITSLADGNYTFRINATDHVNLSNTTETVVAIAIDDTNPLLIFAGGTETTDTYFNRSWVYVNVSESDTNFKNITFYLFNSSKDQLNATAYTTQTNDTNFTSLDNNTVYYYNVTVVDLAGNTNSTETRTITLDSTDPVLFNPSPADGSYITSTTQVFEINMTEQNLDTSVNVTMTYRKQGLGWVTPVITLDCFGTAPNYICNKSVNLGATLTDGDTAEYFFNTTDLTGLTATNGTSAIPLSLVVDLSNPYISGLVSSDADNITKNDTNINFTVTASDTNIDTVTLNGTAMTHGAGNTYHLWINTSALGCAGNAACTVGATATDLAGRTNTTTYSITTDDINPAIVFAGGTETTGTYFNRNWTYVNVSESDTNFKNITFYLFNSTKEQLNATAYTTQTNDTNFTSLNSNMVYYYNVTIVDLAGNTNLTETRNITLDSTNPSISGLVSSDADNVTKNDTNINFTVTASDTNLANVTLNNSYVMSTDGGNIYYKLINTSALGCAGNAACTVGATATDLALNTLTTTYTLTTDDTNPVVALITPIDNYYSTSASVTFGFNTTEIHPDTCVLYHNGSGTWLANYTNNSYANGVAASFATAVVFNSTADKDYKWNVLCNDTAGNSVFNGTNYTLHVDNYAPVITLTGPLNDTWDTDGYVEFNVTVVDNNSDSCNFYISNKSLEWPLNETKTYTSGTMLSFNETLAENATGYSWKIICNDSAAQSDTLETYVIKVDTIHPTYPSLANVTISSTLYGNNTLGATLTPTVNWTAVTETNFLNYTLQFSSEYDFANLNSTVIVTSGASNNSVVLTTALLDNYQYYWRVIASDQAGNTNTSQIFDYKTDTVAPVVTLSLPTDDYQSSSSSVSFNWTSVDNNSNTCILYGDFNGTWKANATTLVSTANGSVLTLPNGTYTWNVWCNDTSNPSNNAWASSNYTVIVDTNTPVITTAINGTTTALRTIAFNITNAGTATVNFSTIAVTPAKATSSFNSTRDCSSISGGYTCSFTETGLIADVTNNITISGNNTARTVKSYALELTLDMKYNYSIPLVSGWNLVSVPLRMTNTDINYTVADSAYITKIHYFDGSDWTSWYKTSSDTINTFTPLDGYWVYTSTATALHVFGNYSNTDASTPSLSKSLAANKWYMIGHYSENGEDDMETDNVLLSLCGGAACSGLTDADDISFDVLKTYNSTGWVPIYTYSSGNQWDRGVGFWIHTDAADTYTK